MKRLLLVALLCASASAQTINPNQIRPSATNGQVLTTAGGQSAWGPATGGSAPASQKALASDSAGTIIGATDVPLLDVTNTWTGTNNFTGPVGMTQLNLGALMTGASGNAPNIVTTNSPGSTTDLASWNGSGVLADSGVLPANLVTLSGTQTITGPKTFTGAMSTASITSNTDIQGQQLFGASEVTSEGFLNTQATTPATSSANQVGGAIYAQSNYWNGTASAFDKHSCVPVLGSGPNPTSVMTCSHSGTSNAGVGWSFLEPVATKTFTVTTNLVNAAGMQVATGSGCSTGTPALSTCTANLTLAVAEPDTSYSIVGCSITGASSPALIGETGNTSTTVIAAQEITASASGSTGGVISCLVIHN
jgi:hypothetical protein